MSAVTPAFDLAGLSTGLTSLLSSLWIRMFWQSTVLAATGWLGLKAAPRLSARLQYRWLFGCYVFCVALPIAASLLSLRAAAASTAGTSPLLTLDPHWAVLWTAICALASAYALARLVAGLWSMHRMVSDAREADPEHSDHHAAVLMCAARGPVRLLVSDRVSAPVAVGLGRPAVVLPEGLIEQLSPAELEQVLRHEVEHLARRDDWSALLFALVRCAAPLIPALLWLEQQLAAAREMACDDAVLRTTRPRAYAENLARLAATRFLQRAPRFAPQFLGHRSQLAERIDHILDAGRMSVTRISLRRLIPTGAAALLVCCGLVESPALVGFAPAPPAVAQTVAPAVSASDVHAIPASLIIPKAATPHVRLADRGVHTRRTHRRATPAKPLLLASIVQPEAPSAAALTAAPPEPSALQFVLVFWTNTRQSVWFTTTTFILHSGPAARSGDAAGLHEI